MICRTPKSGIKSIFLVGEKDDVISYDLPVMNTMGADVEIVIRPAKSSDGLQTNLAIDPDIPSYKHVKAAILNRQNPEINIERNSDSNDDPYTPSLNQVAESMGLPTSDRVMSQREKAALAILGHDALDGMVRRYQRRREEEEEGE